MACGCNKNRPQYEVVMKATEEKPEKAVWSGTSEAVAKNVAKRYNLNKSHPVAVVREKVKAGAKTA